MNDVYIIHSWIGDEDGPIVGIYIDTGDGKGREKAIRNATAFGLTADQYRINSLDLNQFADKVDAGLSHYHLYLNKETGEPSLNWMDRPRIGKEYCDHLDEDSEEYLRKRLRYVMRSEHHKSVQMHCWARNPQEALLDMQRLFKDFAYE